MTDRYAVHYDGPRTSITEHPDGPSPRWDMARAAAIEHLDDHVRECKQTLGCLRRAANFFEYEVLSGETVA